jgi:hypothetical protein
MIVTYKTLDRIEFPVFILPSSNWDLTDGLLYLDGELLDDRNMPGKTLGQRRLQTPHKGLLPLRKSVDSLVGILKQYSYYFVDSKGVPFIYQKTLILPLKYRKIRKIEKKTTASLIWIENWKIPFTIPRPPSPDMLWAGVLLMRKYPWIIYEYSETKKKNTRRKV